MRSPRVGPWGPNVRGGGAPRGHRGWRSSRFRAGSWTRVLLVVSAAGRRRSSTFALVGATGKGNVRRRRDGDVWGATSGDRVHICGARGRPVLPPHRAARQDRERRARPRRRLLHPPARPVLVAPLSRDRRPGVPGVVSMSVPRPRTVCVVPRERSDRASLAAFRASRRDPVWCEKAAEARSVLVESPK